MSSTGRPCVQHDHAYLMLFEKLTLNTKVAQALLIV